MRRFPRTSLAAIAASAVILTGCGASNDSGNSDGSTAGSDTSTDTTGSTTTSPTPSAPTKPAAPAYRVLGKAALTKTLLSIQDLPPGYSQDAPQPENTKTFCDYKQPFTRKFNVYRDFTKGGGLSAEYLSVGIREFANPQQAKAAFRALSKALKTCTGETYEGSKLTYAPMSTPRVGDAAVGVKITADNSTGLQNFVLVGPSVINTGGVGLTNVNADAINQVLEAQVKAYEGTATQ